MTVITTLLIVYASCIKTLYIFQGGMYIFQIVDWFVATSVVAIGLFEVCSLAWFYGNLLTL